MTKIGFCSSWHRVIVGAVLLAASDSPALAADRHVIEVQVQVQAMSDQAMIMQQSIDENFGAMSQSFKQTRAQLAASREELARWKRVLQTTSPMATGSARWSRQVAELNKSTRDLDSGLQGIEDRVQTLSTEIGQPVQAVVPAAEAPRPDVLFHSALKDYEAGNYKLAGQEFAEYVKFYSSSDQAGQAQFYLADSEYWGGDYKSAVQDFDKLEQQYPATEPASVKLKEGLSLMKMGRPDAASAELRGVIQRYPNSVEAMEARTALAKPEMGARTALSLPRW
jgi:TolA-binding protein